MTNSATRASSTLNSASPYKAAQRGSIARVLSLPRALPVVPPFFVGELPPVLRLPCFFVRIMR